jgi:hypothetical protein
MLWHHDAKRKCLNCHEHGAPFDGGCDGCGYADRRWCPFGSGGFHLWEPVKLSPQQGED